MAFLLNKLVHSDDDGDVTRKCLRVTYGSQLVARNSEIEI